MTEKVNSFISGTYVRAFEGEYSIGNDTLIITNLMQATIIIQFNTTVLIKK